MVTVKLTGARTLRHRLGQGSALAAVLAIAAPVGAADIPQGGALPGGATNQVKVKLDAGAFGAATNTVTVPGTTNALGIEVQQVKTIINWGEFNIGAGKSVNFTPSAGVGATTPYAVLNRVLNATTASAISGDLNSSGLGQIWVLNRVGMLFGATARIDTGSFVASTLDVTDGNFGLATPGGNSFTFTRPTDGTPATQALIDAATISLAAPGLPAAPARGLFATGPILLIAPAIVTNGTTKAGGDVGFVVASEATVQLSNTSILGIGITTGTRVNTSTLQILTGSTTEGERVFGVAAADVDPVGALLQVNGAITATNVTAGKNGIVLSAGAAVDAGTTGDVTMPGTASAKADLVLGTGAALTVAAGDKGPVLSAARDITINVAAFDQAKAVLTAGDDIKVTSTVGAVHVGSAKTLGTNDSEADGTSDIVIDAKTDGTLDSGDANQALTVLALGAATLGGGKAGTDIVVTGGSASAGTTSLADAAGDLLVTGNLTTATLGDGKAGGVITALGNTDVTLTGTATAIGDATLKSTTGSVLAGGGTAKGANVIVEALTLTKTADLGTGTAATAITVTAGGAATLGGGKATAGKIEVKGASASAGTTSLADAGTDLLVTGSATTATLGDGKAGGVITILGNTDVSLTGTATAIGDATLKSTTGSVLASGGTAKGANVIVEALTLTKTADLGTGTAATAITVTAGGAATLGGGKATAGKIEVKGASASAGTTSLADAGTDLLVTGTATTATLGDGKAGGIITVKGNTDVSLTGTATATGDTTLESTTGSVLAGGGTAKGANVIVKALSLSKSAILGYGEAVDTITVDAVSVATLGGGKTTTGNIEVTGSTVSVGATSLADAGADLLVTGIAGGTTTLKDGKAGGVITVQGNGVGDVALTGTATAVGDVKLKATGGSVLASGGTAKGANVVVEALTLTKNANLGTGTAANAITVTAGGAATLGGGKATTGNIEVKGASATAGTTSLADAGADLLVTGTATTATLGNGKAGGVITVLGNTDVSLTGTATAIGDVTLTSTTGSVLASGGTAKGANVVVKALTAGEDADLGTGTATGAITVTASGAAKLGGGKATAGNIEVKGASASAGTGSLADAGGDLLVTGTGTTATLGDGKAGGLITVLGNTDAVLTGTATAIGDVMLLATSGSVLASGGTAKGANVTVEALTAGESANLGTGTAANVITVLAGGAATLGGGKATAGNILVQGGSASAGTTSLADAGTDISVVGTSGTATLGNGTAGAAIGVQGFTDATLTGTATANGGDVTLLADTGSVFASGGTAKGTNVIVWALNAGDANLGTGTASIDLYVLAGGAATLGGGTATTGSIVVNGASASAGTTSLASAGANLLVTGTATTATLGSGTAGGVVTVSGNTDATLTGTATANGGDVTLQAITGSVFGSGGTAKGTNVIVEALTAGQSASLGTGTAANAITVTAGGAATLGGGKATTGNIEVKGASASAGTLSLADAGADLLVTGTGTTATLGDGKAAGVVTVLGNTDVTLTGTATANGGDVTLTATAGSVLAGGGTAKGTNVIVMALTAGQNANLGTGTAANAITVTAGGAATLGGGKATAGNIEVKGASASAGAASLADAGVDLLVTGTATTATIGTATATRDILLAAGTTASLGTGLAGRDITINGGAVSVMSSARAGDDVRITATNGSAVIGTAEATGKQLNAGRTDFGATAAVESEAPGDGANVIVRATGAGGSASVTAGRAINDVYVEANGQATLDTGVAGRDIVLIGDGASSATSLDAGDDVAVVANDSRDGGTVRGNALVAVANATGKSLSYAGGFVRSAVAGSASNTEATDLAPLLDALGNPVANPTAAGSLDGLLGSNILIAASKDAKLTSTTLSSSARDLTLLAGGAALLTNGAAVRDITLIAGTTATLINGSAGGVITLGANGDVVLTDNIFATGDVSLSSTTGLINASAIEIQGASVTLTAATDATLGKTTALAGDITVLAGNNIVLTNTVVASGNVDLTATTGAITATASTVKGANIILNAGTNANLGDATAGFDINIKAGGVATLGSGIAGRDITLVGASAAVTTQALADDDVIVVATAGDATVNLVRAGSGTDSEAGNDATLALDAAGAAIANPATGSGAGNIARLGGNNIVIAASGDVVSTSGTTWAATDVRLAGGGTVNFTDARAGRDLVAIGSTVTATGASTRAQAGDDVVIVARTGAAQVDTLTSTGLGLNPVSGADLASPAVDNEPGDGTLAGLANGSTIADPTKGIATPLTRFAGNNAVAIAATTATVTTGTALRDVRVVAGGDATLTDGTAGRDLLLLAGGNAASTGILRAGDDATVIATGGTATVNVVTATGTGPDSESGDAIALFDASGVGIANPATGSGAGTLARLTGSNIIVAATGNVTSTSGTTYAANDVRLASGGTVNFTDARAGRDLLIVGTSVTGTTAQGGDDVAIVARTGAAQVDTLTATGLGLDSVTGADLATAAADSEAGNPVLLGLSAAGTIDDPTKAPGSALTGFIGNNVLAIAATTATVTTGTAARDVRVVAGTDAVLTSGAAGRDLLLLAGRDATSTGNLIAGDDIAVVASGGAATLVTASIKPTAALDSETGDATPLFDASGGAVGDPYGWQGSASIDTLAGRNIIVVGATGATAATLGDPAVAGAVRPRQVRLVTLAGDADVTTAAYATDLIWVGSRQGNAGLVLGDSLGDITVKADLLDATLTRGIAGSDILVSAGRDAVLPDGSAGDDIYVLAGRDATVTTARVLGTSDDDGAGTALQREDGSGDLISLITGRRIDRIDGSNVMVEAGGDARITTATAREGGFGRDVRLGALGTTDVTTASARRDVTAQAGGVVTVGTAVADRDVTILGAAAGVTLAVAGDDVAIVARTGAATVATARALGRTLDLDPASATFGAPSPTAATGNEIAAAAQLLDLALAPVADPSGSGFIAGLVGSNVFVAGTTGATLTSGTAATDLKLATATGGATLTSGRAGQDLLILGDAVTVTGFAEAGDDVALVARVGNVLASGAVVRATGTGFDATAAAGAGAFGSGVAPDSESSDATALLGLDNAAIANPATGSGAGNLARLLGSNAVLAAAGDVNTVGGTTWAATDVRLAGGGTVDFTDARAGRDLLAIGSTVTATGAGTRAQGGDDVAIVARTGAAQVDTLTATGLGLDAATGANLATAAADSEAGNPVLLGLSAAGTIDDPTKAPGSALTGFIGNNVLAIAATTATVITGTAPGDVRVVAGTDATLTNGTAGRDLLLLAGGNAASTGILGAGDDAAIIATGGTATVNVVTATGAGPDSESAESIALFDASGVGIANPATGSGAGTLARLTGSNIIVAATGNVTSTSGTTYAANDVRLASGGTVNFTDARAGRDLLILGTDVTGTTAQAGDDVAIVARTGAAQVDTLTATGLGLNAVTGADLATSAFDNEPADDNLAGLADGSTIADPTKGIATPLARFGGNNVLAIAATTATVTTGTALRDVRVVAGGDATLTDGTAGRDLLLLAGGNAASTGVLRAGDDAAIIATGGTATVNVVTATGAGPDSESGDAIALFDASGVGIANPATGSGAGTLARLTGSNIIVAATGNVTSTSGTTYAATDVRLASGGTVNFTDARAGRDLLVVGTSVTGTTAQGGDDVAIVARTGAAQVDTLTATGQGLDAVTGADLATAAADSEAGNPVLLGLSAAGTIDDPTKAPGSALTGFIGNNVLAIGATTATVTTGTALRDVRVVAGTDATLTTGTAGRDLLLLAGGNAVSTNSLSAGDDLAVVAGGNAAVSLGASTGSFGGPDDADGDPLLDASGGSIGDPTKSGGPALTRFAGSNTLVIGGGTAAVDTGSAAGDLRVVAGASSLASLIVGTAGRDVLLLGGTVQSTGASARPGTATAMLSAGDDATVIATGGTATVNVVTATGAGPDSESADSIALFDASGVGIANPATGSGAGTLARLTGSNIIVAATGNVTSTSGTTYSATDVRLASGGTVNFTDARAGRDLLIVGTSVTGTTAQGGDDVAIVARTGAAQVDTLTTTGLGLNPLTGANLATAATDNEPADDNLAGLADGSSIADPTKGIATPLARFGGNNVLAVGATTATVVTGTAKRDVRVVAGTDATLTTGTAGRDLLLLAGGNAVSTGSLNAGDDAAVVAKLGTATIRTIGANGTGADSEAGDSAALLDASGTAIGDPTKAAAPSLDRLAGANVVVIAANAATVTTANAARDLRVVGGNTAAATLTDGTAGRDILLLGGTATSATRLAAGDDVVAIARAGAATVALATASGTADSESGATAVQLDASGGTITDPAPVAAPMLVGLTQANVVVAASGNATIGSATAQRDIRMLAGGDTSLAQGTATAGDIIIEAGGTARASQLTAGRDLNLTSSDIDLNSAPQVTIARAVQLTVRNPNAPGAATQTAVIGDIATAPGAGTWTLGTVELAAIRTPSLDINAGSRLVLVGAATPNAGAGPRVDKFAVATTGNIDVLGAVSMPGAGRTLTLGGTTATADAADNAASATAGRIRIITSPQTPGGTALPNGQIQAAGGVIRLRANTIAVGLQSDFQTEVTGTPLTQAEIINQFFLRPTSNLYTARPTRYTNPGTAATYITAATLALSVGDWALLQNTDISAQPGGGASIGVLRLVSSTPGDPTVAVFGSLGGLNGVAASLQIGSIELNGIVPFNVRINGCVALQGVGCIANNVVVPDPKLPNPSSAFLLTVAPSLAVPIDLISGGTNEALWRDDQCDKDDPNCPKTETKP